MMKLISEEAYIAHHGIKGQKWGVRRFRNEDGTLTEAGKKRLSKDLKKVEKTQNDFRNKEKRAIKAVSKYRSFNARPMLLKNDFSIAANQRKFDKATHNYDKSLRKANKAYSSLIRKYGRDNLSSMNSGVVSTGEELYKQYAGVLSLDPEFRF